MKMFRTERTEGTEEGRNEQMRQSELKNEVSRSKSLFAALRSQFATTSRGGRRTPSYAFTEHGAIMAATVLSSPEAVKMSVFVVRAFVQMREQLAANTVILKRLAEIDKTLLDHDKALSVIWRQIQPLLAPPPASPKPRIGFHHE